ncbi:MAG: Stealth CR1 domain-containing protein [Muribaculaceae bacterium]|nr:Stealth CR1 domain-containing protein [Muribaculaceae bacterium]
MRPKENEKIDFVITWVDDNDPVWQNDFHYYRRQSQFTDDTRNLRYRNWDNLRYLFRGVEKFAPWVNKVHLITCGHIPDWLDINAPKLNFVKHSDYIPNEYLPTFSSRPITLNLHRINELSEHFVLFDDDCFLIDKVNPERFFRKGLPCDKAALNPLSPNCNFSHNILSDLVVVNSSFNKYDVISRHFWKWITPQAGSKIWRTLLLLPWPRFSGFYDHHLPQIFLKSTFEEVWEKHEDIMVRTTASRFRSITDVNSWLIRYWQLAKGNFAPLNVQKDSAYFSISDNTLDKIVNTIECQTKRIICLNDGEISSFEAAKEQINAAFDKILPEKSSFEK